MGNISGDLHDNNPFGFQTCSSEMGNSSGQVNRKSMWTFNKNDIDQGRYSQLSGTRSASDRNQQQNKNVSDNRPFSDSIQQPNDVIIRMAELKRLLSKYLPTEKVQDILSSVCEYCRFMGDYFTLDSTLDEARKKVEFREARDYLNGS